MVEGVQQGPVLVGTFLTLRRTPPFSHPVGSTRGGANFQDTYLSAPSEASATNMGPSD